MPGKNNVAQLRGNQTVTILPTVTQTVEADERVKKTGRTPKPEAEKQKNRVSLLLTDAEFAVLNEKRGLVNAGTYIRDIIIKTRLFDASD